MGTLRVAVERHLDGWRSDLSAPWRALLDGAEPDLAAITDDLTIEPDEVVIPGRKGRPAATARDDSHVFRALDDVRPEDVRAVVLGQDPYPKASRATGRAFEQGDLAAWSRKRRDVAESLRRIVQTL